MVLASVNTLHSSVSLMTSVEGSGILLLRIPHKYFEYAGTCMTSSNKMLTYNFELPLQTYQIVYLFWPFYFYMEMVGDLCHESLGVTLGLVANLVV